MPVLTVKNTELSYTVRRSARIRSQRITVTPGKIEVVASKRTPNILIRTFVYANRQWIYKKWMECKEKKDNVIYVPKDYRHGMSIPYRGKAMPLEVTTDKVKKPIIKITENSINLTLSHNNNNEKTIKLQIKKFLKEVLRQDVQKIIAIRSKQLNLTPNDLRIKEQKTRWGSCSSKGNININLNLIFTPYEVLEYVVVHELCHLQHPNHSKQFWSLVESILPDYKASRKYLKSVQM